MEILRSHSDWLWLGSAYEGLSCAAIAMKINEPLLQGDGLNWKSSSKMNYHLFHNLTTKNTLSGRLSPANVTKKPTQAGDHGNCGELGASIEEPISINEEENFEENTQNGYDDEEQEEATDSIMQRFLQKDFVVDKFTRALHYYGKVLIHSVISC